VAGRLGPLVERDFRLLFAATSITTVGDRLATVALPFAVLELGSVTDVGLVLAARQVVQTLVLVAGGVLSDRLPRQLVLTGASLVQAVAQALTATLLLSGAASVDSLIALQALYGVGAGMIVPAEVGLVPQTVRPERLQQANALQGLSRNVTGVVGPAVGGAIVVATSPGAALAADAASFAVCAALLARIRVPPPERERASFLAELREGWEELTAQTWIWSTIGLFGFSNMFYLGSWAVLGPAIAERELGGAGAWATILAAGGVGAVVGGLFVLRYRPRRPLVACVLAPLPMVLPLVGLALLWPTWLIAGAAFASSVGLAVHLALWFTVFQRHVPEHAQSRVSSYDALGSFVLVPVGMAFAGPMAGLVGTTTTLWITVGVFLGAMALIVSVPSVRRIRAPEADPVAA
jgi:MFS family permease